MLGAAEGGELQEWASRKGLTSDLGSLCRNDEARKWVLTQLNATAKESKLRVSGSASFVTLVLSGSILVSNQANSG